MKSYFYYTEESILNFKNTRRLVLRGQEDKILTEKEMKEQRKTELYKDCVIYESEIAFVGYPILENEKLRPATLVELIDLGEQKLLVGEYIDREQNEVVYIEQPSWQYKWDYENFKWIVNEDTIKDGQYVEGDNIIDVPYDETLGYLIPHWNKESHVWEEGATEEEKASYYKELINTLKAKILEQGYNYNEHQQKCRDKDLALLGNAIAANEDMAMYSKTLNTVWSFNDGDILEMSLDELKRLRLMGAVFVQAIFTVEAQLKAGEVNIHFTGKEFIEKVNEISDVKCYFDDIKETEIPSSYKVGGGGTNLSNISAYSQNVNTKLRNVNTRTLPQTGIISMNDVRNELGRTGAISLNDSDVRELAGKSSGTISLKDLYGKSSSFTADLTVGYNFSKEDFMGGTIDVYSYGYSKDFFSSGNHLGNLNPKVLENGAEVTALGVFLQGLLVTSAISNYPSSYTVTIEGKEFLFSYQLTNSNNGTLQYIIKESQQISDFYAILANNVNKTIKVKIK